MTYDPALTTSDPSLMTIHDLRELLRCGRTTAYARVHEPGFPEPVVLSASAHRWWRHEVLEWVDGRRSAPTTPDLEPPLEASSRQARPAAPPRPVPIRRRNHHD